MQILLIITKYIIKLHWKQTILYYFMSLYSIASSHICNEMVC